MEIAQLSVIQLVAFVKMVVLVLVVVRLSFLCVRKVFNRICSISFSLYSSDM